MGKVDFVTIASSDKSLVDAYLNEFKGNLLEFLIASKLARHFKLESKFLEKISIEFKSKLSSYESFIRTNKPDLLKILDGYSNQLLPHILKLIDFSIDEIILCGKVAKASQDNRFEEADLLMVGEKILPISLKLSKFQSYVNTKSAGIKSFISFYFSIFNKDHQNELNHLVDLEFNNMSYQLHQNHNIQYLGNYELWREHGLTELPGKLAQQDSDVLKSFYQKLIIKIHQSLTDFLQQDEKSFLQCLYPLIGFGKSEMIQAICFHTEHSEMLKEIKIFNFSEISNIRIDQMIVNNSYFNIYLHDKILQIRVKPMNKFTNTSLKINCSVKY